MAKLKDKGHLKAPSAAIFNVSTSMCAPDSIVSNCGGIVRISFGLASGLSLGLLAVVMISGYAVRLAEYDAQQRSAEDFARLKANRPFAYIFSAPPTQPAPVDLSLQDGEQCIGGHVVLVTKIGNLPRYSEEAHRGHLLTCRANQLLIAR